MSNLVEAWKSYQKYKELCGMKNAEPKYSRGSTQPLPVYGIPDSFWDEIEQEETYGEFKIKICYL